MFSTVYFPSLFFLLSWFCLKNDAQKLQTQKLVFSNTELITSRTPEIQTF